MITDKPSKDFFVTAFRDAKSSLKCCMDSVIKLEEKIPNHYLFKKNKLYSSPLEIYCQALIARIIVLQVAKALLENIDFSKFDSWDDLCCHVSERLANIDDSWKENPEHEQAFYECGILSSILEFENNKGSFYGVTNGLMTALLDTDLPDEIYIPQIAEKNLIILLPEFILIESRVDRLTYIKDIVVTPCDEQISFGGMSVVCSSQENSLDVSSFYCVMFKDERGYHGTPRNLENINIHKIVLGVLYHLGKEKEKEQNEAIAVRPLSKHNSRSNKIKASERSIKIIGESYKPRIKYVSSASNGTHDSPITHWRRGHWRNHRCGKQLQDTKLIWIKPVLINAI